MIQPKKFITPEEYLALEQASRDKHEYWHGEMYMMAGTSLNDNQIVNNTYVALNRCVERCPAVFLRATFVLGLKKKMSMFIPM